MSKGNILTDTDHIKQAENGKEVKKKLPRVLRPFKLTFATGERDKRANRDDVLYLNHVKSHPGTRNSQTKAARKVLVETAWQSSTSFSGCCEDRQSPEKHEREDRSRRTCEKVLYSFRVSERNKEYRSRVVTRLA